MSEDVMQHLQEGDKIALLMVHFGTTHDNTRALTIDALNQKAKAEFPQLEFREAYTSRIIMRRLAKRGMRKLNPVEALAQLKADGYTHVIIQSTNIIDGIEMESLRKDIDLMRPLFKEIRLGMPLLYTPEDYKQVIDCLVAKAGRKPSPSWWDTAPTPPPLPSMPCWTTCCRRKAIPTLRSER